MDTEFPQSLIVDETRYTQAFAVFAKQSKLCERLASLTNNAFPRLVIQKLKPEDGRPLMILDVGSGTGETECIIVSKLLTKFPQVSSTVVEPNQKSLVIFKENVEKRGLLSVKWEYQNKTWDQYYKDLKAADSSNQFDLITSVHSMYHLGETDTIITQLLDCLADGGVLSLTMNAGYSTGWSFLDCFPMLPGALFAEKTTTSVKEYLEEKHIQFEIDQTPLSIDVTDCFDPDNEEGQLMLDFLMHVSQFRKTASSELVNAVLEGIGSPDFSMKVDGKIIVKGSNETIVIQK